MEPAVNSLLSTTERARELLDSAPWLGFTLDVAHAMAKDEKEPERYIDLCGDRIVNVHMSTIKDGRPHCPLDHDPLMRSILHRLAGIGFGGSLTLEIEDLNFPRVLTSKEKIGVIGDDIAFMKECMGVEGAPLNRT
jgi:sugar phosphate isomerase/epimerase